MTETFEDRTDRRLTQIEATLHNIDERTAALPALINRVLERRPWRIDEEDA